MKLFLPTVFLLLVSCGGDPAIRGMARSEASLKKSNVALSKAQKQTMADKKTITSLKKKTATLDSLEDEAQALRKKVVKLEKTTKALNDELKEIAKALEPEGSMPLLPEGVHVEISAAERGNSFSPYDEISVRLVFHKEVADKKISGKVKKCEFSDKSLFNNRAYYLKGIQYFDGETVMEEKSNTRIRHWLSLPEKSGVIPRREGRHKLDLVVSTPVGLWRVPTRYVSIFVAEGDRESYKSFRASRCDEFFTDKYGMRQKVSRKKTLNYRMILKNLKKYPNSSLVASLKARSLRCMFTEMKLGENFFNPEDKKNVARILVLIDKQDQTIDLCQNQVTKLKGLIKKSRNSEREAYKKQLKDFERWYHLLMSVKEEME
jgi:hypothetical protein